MSSLQTTSRRLSLTILIVLSASIANAETPIDFAAYTPDCAVKVEGWNGNLRLAWPTADNETAVLTLDMTGQQPLIQQMAIRKEGQAAEAVLTNVDPVWFLTVGERRANDEKSPEQKWEVFFDNPHKRPHETFTSKFTPKQARVIGSGQRCKVVIDELTIGPFTGSIEITCYAGSRLIRLDAAIQTEKDRLAVFYDTGLVSGSPSWKEIAWIDTEGISQKQTTANIAKPINVRHRTIVASSDKGSVACFPPPHQFQFPRDYSTNLGFVWSGIGYQGHAGRTGFGIRQNKDGGGNYVPWVNAPPGVMHRMGVFYLLTTGTAADALSETLKFTHHDRFVDLPGYKTFSSHYHMAIAVNAMKDHESGKTRPEAQDYVRMFKDMNVNMVHLGEFHGDGNPRDPGPLRLKEMQAMFDECRRWSDDKFLLMPGEEANVHLGLTMQGKQPGHWMLYFPRPVYWTMVRGADQPFVEEIAPYGKVYHVGDRGDMIRLREEHGLAWTAHPRLKGSAWTPDLFRHEDFFLAEFWLGGAWKAMPADTSREKLGERVLNLMDDMANWGHRKYVPGEVDIFTLDHTHELYGHMNINYVQLDRIPRYDEGWQPVLDALKNGKFFVTTGEILIPKFTVGPRRIGVSPVRNTDDQPELVAEIQWTFPLAFAEIISGDGQQVFRERIDLSDTTAFGTRTLKLNPQLTNRRWVRLEIWDIAANGAFTQPVWIE